MEKKLTTMFQRGVIVLLLISLTFGVSGVTARAEQVISDNPLTWYAWDNIPAQFRDGGTKTECENYFWYNPGMFFLNSGELNPSLAKMSVALASMAYDHTRITKALERMGFNVLDTLATYQRQLTLDDCDHVAFAVGVRDLEDKVTGETYKVYCVPIRGTAANAEWFSNFNVGRTGVHDGFQRAADEVYAFLQQTFLTDGAERRIVLLTGHSRGAAVSNIIAGTLSTQETFVTKEHVFAYNFACPSFSKWADAGLTNIFNFNNPGDIIPKLPLGEWGYRRNGISFEAYTENAASYDAVVSNIRRQFLNTTGQTWASMTSTDAAVDLLKTLGLEREVQVYEPAQRGILLLLCYALDDAGDVSLKDVLNKWCGEEIGLLSEKAQDMIADIEEANTLPLLLFMMDQLGMEVSQMEKFVEEAELNRKQLSDEEYAEWVEAHAEEAEEILLYTGVDLSLMIASELLGFGKAYEELHKCYDLTMTVSTAITDVNNILLDSQGNPASLIQHGHTCATYISWVNSLFGGYHAWRGNSEMNDDVFRALPLGQTIEQYAFYGCIG